MSINERDPGKIRWGIIGCGNVTELKSGPAFNKIDGSSLLAVMRRDPTMAADYAMRHKVPRWYHDADDLINDNDINAIYIATPPAYHKKYAIAAMQAGKYVYIEKPMSIDVASCMEMVEVAEKTGMKLCVAHYRRGLPMFNTIKQLLHEGIIGNLRTVHLTLFKPETGNAQQNNWRVDPLISGGGLFYDLAPHQLDLMLYFFGDYKTAYGISANQAGLYQPEDVVTSIIHFESGIIFSGQRCFTVDKKGYRDLCEITGSLGKLSFPVFGNEVAIRTRGNKKVLSFDHPIHIQQPMINKVVRYFLGDTHNPCSGADAIKSMRLMENFVKSN